MSDLERLREEYCTLTEDSEDMFLAKDFVDRLIAALEAELERVRAEPTACYVHPETGHGSATGANEPSYEMTAYVVDWKRRAEQAEAEARKWEWVAREVVFSGYSRADIMQGLHEHDITDALARYEAEHGGEA